MKEIPEYKKAQRAAEAFRKTGRLMEPTLEHRLRKLSAFERHEVRAIIQSMVLRKTIKRILSEAHTQAQVRDWRNSLMNRRLDAAVAAGRSIKGTTYDPVIVQGYDHKPRLILPGEEHGAPT